MPPMRPWMIEFGPLNIRHNRGKEVLDVMVEVAKERCKEITVSTNERFTAYDKDRGLAFMHADVCCAFFFKLDSATHSIRLNFKIGYDVGSDFFFTFEEGVLGGGGYGTDWKKRTYDEIMKYPFFKETYDALIEEWVKQIQEKLGIPARWV